MLKAQLGYRINDKAEIMFIAGDEYQRARALSYETELSAECFFIITGWQVQSCQEAETHHSGKTGIRYRNNHHARIYCRGHMPAFRKRQACHKSQYEPELQTGMSE